MQKATTKLIQPMEVSGMAVFLVPKLIVDGNLNQNAFQILNQGAKEYYTSLIINGLQNQLLNTI